MRQSPRSYQYIFSFPDAHEVSFTINLDETSRYIAGIVASPPPWTRLRHHQCQPCTLAAAAHPYCPIAIGIFVLVDAFAQLPSYAPCKVMCISPERTISKDTSVQDGLASILGLQMATSGCPVMDFLRPLARFHLPFATVEESLFRTIANFLLRHYYENTDPPKAAQLSDIKAYYQCVKQVNRGMLARLLDINSSDADKNAIVTLNSLAQILEIEVDDNLETLKYLFA